MRQIRNLTCSTLFLVIPVATLAQDPGVGLGVKMGFLQNSTDTSHTLDSGSGWMAGLFLGGNRSGAVGVMTELNILAKNTADKATYHFQIPAMLRINIGPSNTGGRRVIVYGVAGPALDLRLGEDLRALRGIDDIESIDTSLIVGIGLEIARFIVEGRGSWGIRNLSPQAKPLKLKSKAFAALVGLRFN